MSPTQQHFKTDDGAVGLGLRLVIQLQLAIFDRHHEVALQQALVADLLVHRGLEESDRATLLGLGAIKREIRMGDQALDVTAILRKYRDADTAANADVLAVDLKHIIEHRRQPRAEIVDILRLASQMRD